MVRIASWKRGFEHTYKISASNSHKKCNFFDTKISIEYLEEFAKRYVK